jgi:hypothetical protein
MIAITGYNDRRSSAIAKRRGQKKRKIAATFMRASGTEVKDANGNILA